MKQLRSIVLLLCLGSFTATSSVKADFVHDAGNVAKGLLATAAIVIGARGLCSLLAWRAEWRFSDELKTKEITTNINCAVAEH